jgi:hypothetical protein
LFVGANCSVRTKSPELAADGAFWSGINEFFFFQRSKGYVVYDTNREAILRFVGFKVFIYSKNLGRSSILGTQTIPASNDNRSVFLVVESVKDVQKERLAGRNQALWYGSRTRPLSLLFWEEQPPKASVANGRKRRTLNKPTFSPLAAKYVDCFGNCITNGTMAI